MILCDSMEYKFRRYLKQSGPSCTVYAFLGVMAECVENKTGVKTDFLYDKEYQDLHIKETKFRLNKLSRIAQDKGFKTIDGRNVKATDIVKMGRYPNYKTFSDVMCKNIQAFSPCITTLRYNRDTSLLKERNGILSNIFKYKRSIVKANSKAHAIAIVGFDREKELFQIANSWGKKVSKKYIKFEDLYKIFSGGRFIKNVSITK